VASRGYNPIVAGLGTFISPGRSLDRALERVALADRLGFDSVYTTHIAGRDSLAVLATYAAATERVRLGTGVLPIFSRTPVATAQTAATIDEYSGGRMVLGLGVSHQVTVENWFDAEISKPVTQMREYAGIVRAIFRGEAPPEGEFFNTRFRFMGYGARPDLPIYVAALSPNMLRLAGEIADGVMLWLCVPGYVRDVVIPAVREGRERAGRPLEGFDIVAAVPSALSDDPGAARDSMRRDLIPYFNLPFYRRMIEGSGFGSDIEGFDAAQAKGDADGAAAAISDRFLGELAAIGSPADLGGAIDRYRAAGTVSPCIGGIPGTDFEATLEAAAELSRRRSSS
jgi:alkanesulfonate monooxygenase SsuD/methylene tetrahydromethanopterin reductase-like flavin-dependent oxidoreductase (luciferase family)